MLHCYEYIINKEKSELDKLVEMPLGDLNELKQDTLSGEIGKLILEQI